MARAETLFERIAGSGVDLTSRRGLDKAPAFRERIQPDLIAVF